MSSRLHRRRQGAIRSPLLVAIVAATSLGFAAHGVASAQEKGAKNVRADLSLGGGAAPPPVTERIALVADLDDDDNDEKADALSDFVSPAARVDLVTLEARFTGATLSPTFGREHVRVVAAGKVFGWGERVPAGAQLQGLSPGRTALVARWPNGRETSIAVDVHGVTMRDGQARAVDMASEHASLDRAPPARVDLDDVEQLVDDPDALRVVVSSPEGTPLGPITVESVGADGATLDATGDVRLLRTSCGPSAAPAQNDLSCWATAPLRFVVDDVDRRHPLVIARSI
ncbi:MAG: hypothetical protein K0S65_6478, partial [Labilithrix sp.]|nr:hypothetical protein [Labilithrix sp.]